MSNISIRNLRKDLWSDETCTNKGPLLGNNLEKLSIDPAFTEFGDLIIMSSLFCDYWAQEG